MLQNSVLDNKTDIELYKDFLNGSKESFNVIIQRYRRPLISFIMKYVKNIEVSEDLAQDTFLYMLVNKKEYDFKYTLKTYLYTIAKCRAINYIKKQNKKIVLDESYIVNLDIENNEDNMDNNLIKKEQYQLLYDTLKKLKQEYQIAIYLADFQGFQYKEISRILNKTMPQTKMLIHRARKSLNKLLRKGDYLC